MTPRRICLAAVCFAIASVASGAEPSNPAFADRVVPIFKKYCTGCHNAADREGKLSLESFADLQQGGENGAVILPGQAESSRLIRVLTGLDEPAMPPEGEKAPTDEEIALLKAWINSGAMGPEGAEPDRKILLTPRIAAASGADQRINSLACSPDGKLMALGRFGTIEIQEADTGKTVRTLQHVPGKVNSLHFSSDGQTLASASGVSGLYGLATLWNVATGSRIRDFEGHRDTMYDAELSPDGSLLATCGYDRAIHLWNVENGRHVRGFEGHNDAVYDIAFSRDGSVLASASGDKTVKIWKVSSGERLDTLSQPQGEQYVVLFSPDDKYILAGGVDNRIRVWQFVSREKPHINPPIHARFAHEGAIVGLAFSGDGKWLVSAAEDRTVKRWETVHYTQREQIEKQPDQVTDLAIVSSSGAVAIARFDGSVKRYDFAASEPAGTTTVAPAQPQIAAIADVPMNAAAEKEPNDSVSQAMPVEAPVRVTGNIDAARDQSPIDADLFRFSAKAGQEWMIEVNAARQKSPLDSKVEVLDARGEPIPRVLLQAVRDSYFTFRGKDFDTSDDFRVFNWEEMEINEYLYANGEVVKLWHYPRGPDSGFIVYPGRGRRWTFFDTTPIAHALGQPCFIVEPHPPGTAIIPNGLPVFPVYYENDDDSWRQWGSDSRLVFVPPADGDYIVRLRDARGMGSENHKYELHLRARKPDFHLKVDGWNQTVNAGSGKEFTINVERLDEFDGEIRVDIENLPPGFAASTPIIVQAGQSQALGCIYTLPDAPKPSPEQAQAAKIVASAEVRGEVIKKELTNLGELKLGDKPKVLVHLVSTRSEADPAADSKKPLELVIAPGQTITAKVRVERNGFEERVPFGNFDAGRNLPHGVYVDNIGLNGLMIVEKQTERTFFITAAKWVPEQTRLFHLQAQVDGNQTSWPVLLRVKRDITVAATPAR